MFIVVYAPPFREVHRREKLCHSIRLKVHGNRYVDTQQFARVCKLIIEDVSLGVCALSVVEIAFLGNSTEGVCVDLRSATDARYISWYSEGTPNSAGGIVPPPSIMQVKSLGTTGTCSSIPNNADASAGVSSWHIPALLGAPYCIRLAQVECHRQPSRLTSDPCGLMATVVRHLLEKA